MQTAQPIAAPDDLRRLSDPRLTLALCFIVLAAIAATAALTAQSLSRLVAAQAATTDSLLVQGQLRELGIGMLSVEKGATGFLVAGQPRYLEFYYGGLRKLLESRDAVTVALRDDTATAGTLDSLNKAVVAKLQVMTHVVALQSAGRTDEARDLLRGDTAAETFDAVRDGVVALSIAEKKRIDEHRVEYARAIRIAYWTLAGSITLNLLLLAGLVLRMRWAAAQQRSFRKATTLRNAELSQLLHAMALRHEQMHGLSELSRFLQSCADTEEAGRVLQQQLPVLMRAAGGALYLFAPSRNQLRQTFSWGEGPFADYLEPGECWALRRGQPYHQPAQGHGQQCAHLQCAAGARPGMGCLPLMAHGDLMGLLVLETGTVDDHRVAQEDEGYRRMTLEQVALSIGNLQLRESLRQQSIRDVLTGLYNRRFLEESVRRELSRATRLQEQGGDGGVALLMIDVDHFKRFNDQHGHEVGDRVLREVGQILQRVTRVSDVAARYGGEEFTILMTDTTAELGRQRAEQIRTAVERMAIEALGTAVGEVTISIGLAQFPAHGSTMEALLLAADKALYQAKHTGRNRVVVAVAA